MDEITFMILKIVVSICAALVTAYVVPYIKTLTNDAQNAKICDAVSIAVKAAEQTVKESGQGKYKKAQVIEYMTKWLNENHISISNDQLDQIIECIVYEINHSQGE